MLLPHPILVAVSPAAVSDCTRCRANELRFSLAEGIIGQRSLRRCPVRTKRAPAVPLWTDWSRGDEMNRTDVPVNNHSPPAAKIALFRSLFRGRDDVYPRRFESRKTGKSGYQPACANEWARGLCDKRAVRCAECPNRRFLPVTDEVVRWHLSGQDGTVATGARICCCRRTATSCCGFWPKM